MSPGGQARSKMSPKTGLTWTDLPSRLSLFTRRNATMIDLDTGKNVQYYSANTKIVVVQKCVTPEKTYYRTEQAKLKSLNLAFEASAFGLPDETAPLAPVDVSKEHSKSPGEIAISPAETNKEPKQESASESGGKPFWRRLFKRS